MGLKLDVVQGSTNIPSSVVYASTRSRELRATWYRQLIASFSPLVIWLFLPPR